MQYAVRSKQCAVRSTQSTMRSFQITVVAVIVLQFLCCALSAQHSLLTNHDERIIVDRFLNRVDIRVTDIVHENHRFHTSVKPYVDKDVHSVGYYIDSSTAVRDSTVGYLSQRFKSSNIYSRPRPKGIRSFPANPDVVFATKPIYEVGVGYDLKSSHALLTTVGGVRMAGDFKEKVGFDIRLISGITTLPNYQDSLAFHHGFVPGWGDRAYFLDSAKYGFQHFSGNIIWRPTPVFNLQVGRDKHFWGDGHRSLFLGDQGPAFPYIKAQTTIWKLQYTSLFAWLQDWTNSTGSNKDFRSKFASFHYLSFNAAKWLNISIFEAVVWQGTDENRSRLFDPNYLNPLVFFRPVEYSLGSSDNAMLGIAGKIRFNRNNVLYGQIILDEFYLKEIKAWKDGWWANKQGAQVGYKCYNFGMVENMFMQMEVNIVRPYTYSHGSPQQSYSNGPLPLAHPMGANFLEFLGILSYYNSGFTVTGKVVAIRTGIDINDTMNFGQNVFQSYITREDDYGNKLWQGCPTNIFLAELTASYVFNTKFPLRVQLTAIARSEKTKWNDPALGALERKLKSSWVMAGVSLPLFRSHNDY